MSIVLNTEIQVRDGEDCTDKVAYLLGEGYRVRTARTWMTGANYGGETPERAGFIIGFQKDDEGLPGDR